MSNKKKKKQDKVAGDKVPVMTKTPAQLVSEFLVENRLIVTTSVIHKQHWRCVLVMKLAKLLGVQIGPSAHHINEIKKPVQRVNADEVSSVDTSK